MKIREPVMSEHAKKILRWRESFLHLEENRFFEIMRMYLGEIKTPYNKQKLIESLEGFFRKKENLSAIKSFLTEAELEIISAVVFINDATEEKLYSFFEKSISFSVLYETLLNLEERLIIFRSKSDKGEEHSVIELNPLLEDAFYDLITVDRLLPEIKFKKKSGEHNQITPEFIACFTAYVLEHPNIAKQDGTLKKHAADSAAQIFGSNTAKITVIYNAFLNLGILKENSRGVDFDLAKLDSFVHLGFYEQLVYIVVASSGHFSRENLRLQAQLFIDTVKNLEGRWFTKDLFLRTGFLAAARPGRDFNSGATKGSGALGSSVRGAGTGAGAMRSGAPEAGSRFARILEEGRARLASKDDGEAVRVRTSGGLERMFEAAALLGMVSECGITDNKETVYFAESVGNQNEVRAGSMAGMLSIDGGMDVSLMPGFALSDIIPAVRFMSLKRYDTVSSFAITRQSIMRGFDSGLSADSILNIIKERVSYDLPETLTVQIDEWNSSYSSASLYKGYILKVEGKAALVAEHNERFSKHIYSIIAPGIYLLDVNSDEEVAALIKESDLDFIGKIKTADQKNVTAGLLPLNLTGRKIDEDNGFEEPKEIVETKNPEEIEKALYVKIQQMNLDPEQRESLEMRLSHKVIVNESQLDASILRLARVNASAMDFSGKVYVIEQAVKNAEAVEISFGTKKDAVRVLGEPVGIQKRGDEAYVQLMLIPEKVVREFALGKATSVKRIRKSIYRD